jgi:ABC-type transporter Mla maintaining outer membrane lipid asymmetry ATPase subunit MlaF
VAYDPILGCDPWHANKYSQVISHVNMALYANSIVTWLITQEASIADEPGQYTLTILYYNIF